ncbi:putative nucleotidyltransferase/DNA-binding XRE family transcriptional regulator [Microbacterium phyllosphaerae]|uniref:Nucleotidyltransferase/DNA-binding XRE family transcriptional regulator n=1 Tax=Microbacterium phyllosphaerae TaxID=124798 RepID=A0ABS4WPA6_9MICO|nr:helix-turn-helix domain-containing protein [Microbacterium phyllosphaerae]MBP2378025.1 putative nucleotidyltransferase/DNA-binding XRE family transcriptional regulator [Microbacterium phyllosphaerae]
MSRAAELIRYARRQSGLTQSALARLAGVTQSVVSEYETGRREPSFDAVDRLISAAGLIVEVTPRTTEEQSARDRVIALSGELRRALLPLGVQRIRLFGSVARDDESASSDIDLAVDVASTVGVFDLLRMRREAEKVLGRPVDLVPSDGLKPAVAEAVEREAVTL